jgi:hypothetical protein
MSKSTETLGRALGDLTRRARLLGLNDTQWAARAGIRKETLSRLRRREGCDFETLQSLARAVGASLGVLEKPTPDSTADGHFPERLDRAYEDRLLELCASGDLSPERWAAGGPRFFMAGLAVMLASGRRGERRELLALAERLHPGASEVAVFDRWLQRSPVRPARFLPLLDARRARAA